MYKVKIRQINYNWEEIDFSNPVPLGKLLSIGFDALEITGDSYKASPYVDFIFVEDETDELCINRFYLPDDQVLMSQLSTLFRDEALLLLQKKEQYDKVISIEQTKYGYSITSNES